MLGNKLINTNAGGGCTNTVDLYNPFPDGGGVALYQLNGDATDVSGNYDGTASNVTYGTGQFGQAGVFNGSSSYIKATNPLYTGSSLTDYTVSAWFKINAYGDQYPTIFVTQTGGATLPPYLWISASILRAHGYTYNDYTNTLSTGVWYNAVMVNSGTTTELYLNGVLQTPTSRNIYTSTTGDSFSIGGVDQYPNTTSFDGSLDQVRIFSRALRPYEVEALYTEEYCTPTIVPSEHFNTVTYTGTGSTGTQIPVGFQPDFVWFKNRSDTDWHILQDSVRGVDKSLFPNAVDAEETYANFIQQLNATGYTIGSDGQINQSGLPYVSWNFKAGGDAVTNTDGTITSQVSANTEAGFSVVKYTGNGVSGATVGHGLIDSPSMIIIKNTVENSATGSGTNWRVYHKDLTAGYNIMLNQTNAQSATPAAFTTTPPSSTVFTLGNFVGTNATVSGGSAEYIAYCFAEVEGFSNFGSYVGNLSSQTNIVTGFEPAFVIIKCSSGFNSGRWFMWDNKRSPSNINQKVFFADLATAEEDNIVFGLNFLENGFSIPTTTTSNSVNQTGYTYIYMAFAADPTAVEPSLEDSFNTVVWAGNGNTDRSIDVGFAPDWVWVKERNPEGLSHNMYDTLRGAGQRLFSNLTNAESTLAEGVKSFDLNGFTVGNSIAVNRSGSNFVAWNWKGAEIPAINSNGSIPSVVSANPAAGFSIVSWTGNGVSGSTIGHGLNEVPEMIIVKNRTSGSAQWSVYHSAYGATKHTLLNTTDAVSTTGDWNNTEPTNSVITFNNSLRTNASGNNYIAYVFHSVGGFSKFGFWQGGTTSINLGFEPAFVLNHDYGAGGGWGMNDSVRGDTKTLTANTSNAETTGTFLTFNSTGFTMPSESSIVFRLYMAFANQF